jgi:hypothetical protein
MEFNEDETSIQLSMDMPGVRGQDIQVTVQRGVLSVRGSRCIRSMDGRIKKKQKLSRRFAVDTDVVDVSRAVANVWNGVLVLYAPKKSKPQTVNIPVSEKADFMFESEIRSASSASSIIPAEQEDLTSDIGQFNSRPGHTRFAEHS